MAVIVGHPEVTKRAYAQDRETREQAVRFAESVIMNGMTLDARKHITPGDMLRLKAQIERDFLVSRLEE